MANLISSPLVKECVDHLSSDENEEKLVASLWGAERCLRVLESVSMSKCTAFLTNTSSIRPFQRDVPWIHSYMSNSIMLFCLLGVFVVALMKEDC